MPPPDDAGNPSIDCRGEQRTNTTHASTTDSAARLYKKTKGREVKLAYLGHVPMENPHGLVVDIRVTQATGTAEREAVLAKAERSSSVKPLRAEQSLPVGLLRVDPGAPGQPVPAV